MAEKCFCHFNGFRVKDSVARQQIVELTNQLSTANANILALSNTINSMNTIINTMAGDISRLATRVTTLENSSSGNTGGDTSGDTGGNTGGGSGDNSGDEPVVSQLAAPTISIASGMLTIRDNSGGKASLFDIYLDGSKVTTVTAAATKTINLEDKTLASYGTYIVKVKAKATGYTDSDFSNSVTFVYESARLAAPTLSISGNYLYIKDNSNAADSYEIFKDGLSLTTIFSTNCYLPTYISKDGTYTITVIAKSNSGFADSPISNSVNYTKTTVDTRKTLSGKWLVDETPSIGSVYEDGLNENFEASIIVGGVATIEGIEIVPGENYIYYYEEASGSNEIAYDTDTEEWSCIPEVYDKAGNRPGLSRQLDFTSGIKVSDEFYNWFTANAEQVTEFPVAPEEIEDSGTYTIEPGTWISDNCDQYYEDPYVTGNDGVEANTWKRALTAAGVTLPCRINFEDGGIDTCEMYYNDCDGYVCYGITFQEDGRMTFNLEDATDVDAICDGDDGDDVYLHINAETYPDGITLNANQYKAWMAVFFKYVPDEN